jgi:flagellar protein FliT
MFANTYASRPARGLQHNLYQQVEVETGMSGATPHQLVAMLFEGWMESVAQARGAMRRGDIAVKCRAIGRAVRIIDEGLAGHRRQRGGDPLNAAVPPPPEPAPPHALTGISMDPQLLSYYEAIEHASAEMLAAARAGNWDEVVKLEGACVLLISRLKHAAQECAPDAAKSAAAERTMAAAKAKSRIMQRILVNDAEIRQLAEPWLQDLDDTITGRRSKTLH